MHYCRARGVTCYKLENQSSELLDECIADIFLCMPPLTTVGTSGEKVKSLKINKSLSAIEYISNSKYENNLTSNLNTFYMRDKTQTFSASSLNKVIGTTTIGIPNNLCYLEILQENSNLLIYILIFNFTNLFNNEVRSTKKKTWYLFINNKGKKSPSISTTEGAVRCMLGLLVALLQKHIKINDKSTWHAWKSHARQTANRGQRGACG